MRSIQKISLLMSLLAFLFLLNACATVRGSSRRQGKLSEAMKEASGDHDDVDNDDRDRVRYIPHSSHLEENTEEVIVDTTLQKTENDTSFKASAFGVNITQGTMYSKNFSGLSGFNITMTALEKGNKIKVDLQAGVHYAPLQKTSGLNASVRGGVVLFNIKLDANFFTTPDYTFFGQYFIVGLGYDYMVWNYKNPVTVIDEYGNESKTSSDAMDGIELYTGVGFNLIQTSNMHVGAEIKPGLILWLPVTQEGFDNDVFNTFKYIMITFKLSFGNMRGD